MTAGMRADGVIVRPAPDKSYRRSNNLNPRGFHQRIANESNPVVFHETLPPFYIRPALI